MQPVTNDFFKDPPGRNKHLSVEAFEPLLFIRESLHPIRCEQKGDEFQRAVQEPPDNFLSLGNKDPLTYMVFGPAERPVRLDGWMIERGKCLRFHSV
jgi:hypothetical protein